MFVIYERPRDYPGHYVVRRFVGEFPTEDFAIARSLEEARTHIPTGLYKLPRFPEDDAPIVEVWM